MATLTHDQLLEFVDLSPDAVIAIQSDGKIIASNNQADMLFEYTHEEMLELHVDLLLPERFRTMHARHRHRFFLSPEARRMGSGLQLFGLRKDGSEFPVDISLRPIAVNSSIIVISIIRDTTAMQVLSDRIEQLSVVVHDKTMLPLSQVEQRITTMEKKMDMYEGKLENLQIKITEVSNETRAQNIVLKDIQEGISTIVAIQEGIDTIKGWMKKAFLWVAGIFAGGVSIAIGTFIINYFSHK